MKKLLIGLLFAGISVLGGNLPSSGDRPQIPYPLARGGRALCSIVLPENAQEFTRMAAEDLKYFLGAITGAEFAVVPESRFQGRGIYLGASAAAARSGLKNFKPEEWCISSPDGKQLILTGGGRIGTFYAVWSLLNQFGCYALTYDQNAIPRLSSLEYCGKFERKQPAFAGRLIFDSMPTYLCSGKADRKIKDAYLKWALRNRINGTQDPRLPALYNFGSYNMSQVPQFHSLNLYVPAELYFKTHPEYFSMNEFGKRFPPRRPRMGGSLCMSNPEVARIALESLRRMIRRDRKERPKALWPTVYDISTLDDSPFICKCPECRKITLREGAETGLLLHFINSIAREIRKEYPDILIRTFGCGPSMTPPVRTKPEDNVLIQLADKYSASDLYVPLLSPLNDGQRVYFEKWSRAARHLAVWDYWNLGGVHFTPARVETVYDALQSDYRYFRSLGISDIFIEAERDYASPQCFIDAAYFAASQLMTDPDQDPERLAEVFFRYYYGPAAVPMKKLFDAIRDGVRAHPGRQTSIVSCWKFCTVPFLFNSYLELKRTAASLPENSLFRQRVEWERITFIWAILAQRQSFNHIFRQHGISSGDLVRECRDLVRRYLRRYPSRDTGRYEKRFEERFLSCAHELVRPVKFQAVPDEDFRMIAWPHFRPIKNLGSSIVPDPDSVQGKALKSANPHAAFHGVNKTLPGEYSRFKTTYFRLGNHGSPGRVDLLLKSVPPDEKYHWFRLPGSITLTALSYFWGHGWAIQAKTSHWYILADGDPEDNTWDEVWMSAKFTGPAYVPGSVKENAVWVDMVVLTGKRRKK